MLKTISIKKDDFDITIVLDKVLYVQLPEIVPLSRTQHSLATVFFTGGSFNLVYAEAKRIADALKEQN